MHSILIQNESINKLSSDASSLDESAQKILEFFENEHFDVRILASSIPIIEPLINEYYYRYGIPVARNKLTLVHGAIEYYFPNDDKLEKTFHGFVGGKPLFSRVNPVTQQATIYLEDKPQETIDNVSKLFVYITDKSSGYFLLKTMPSNNQSNNKEAYFDKESNHLCDSLDDFQVYKFQKGYYYFTRKKMGKEIL